MFPQRLNLGYEVPSSLEDDIFDGRLSVHPNPSKGIFNIDLIDEKNGDYSISVSNILGEEVYSDSRGVTSTTSTRVDLSDLESGIYMLNIQNRDSSISVKVKSLWWDIVISSATKPADSSFRPSVEL